MKAPAVLVTCEHGGNRVPPEYRRLFAGRARLLASHRGLDIGAAHAARSLSLAFDCPLIVAHVTRLLVDLNRSAGHRALFSELTRALPRAERARIMERYYRPYRDLVRGWVAASLARGKPVMHLAIHSFVPVLAGERRSAEVGFLYDPRRAAEARFCHEWQARLAALGGGWRLRRNYPYRGTADGLVTALRRELPAAHYLGVEIEINQAELAPGPGRRRLLRALAQSAPIERWPLRRTR